MEQDTSLIMKSTETAVVLAQILNRFFDNLSNRTIYCSASYLPEQLFFPTCYFHGQGLKERLYVKVTQ